MFFNEEDSSVVNDSSTKRGSKALTWYGTISRRERLVTLGRCGSITIDFQYMVNALSISFTGRIGTHKSTNP